MVKRGRHSHSATVSITVDRISTLPDRILHHVLSFLPTLMAVQTCILSKRWKDLWCSTPSLHFHQDLFLVRSGKEEMRINFFRFVDFVLFYRNPKDIDKLSLSCGHTNFVDQLRVNAWIVAAIKHNIKVLELEIVKFQEFQLIPRIFSCASLMVLKLHLNYSELNLPCSISFSTLKTLHLMEVTFTAEGLVEALLSGCPMLEVLIMKDCVFNNHRFLVLSCQELKSLRVEGAYWLNGYPTLSFIVSAPSLQYMELDWQNLILEECILDKLTSLIKADIKVNKVSHLSLFQIIRGVINAHSVTLSVEDITSWKETIPWSCPENPFINLKFLELGNSLGGDRIQLINNILQCSRCIETLIFDIYEPEASSATQNETWFDCSLSHLKLVKIQGFQGLEKQIEFLKLLLKNAVVLEKMTISATAWAYSRNKKELREIVEMLLTCPRASSSVGIFLV